MENIPNAIANSYAFIPTKTNDSITVQIEDNQDTTSFTWNIDLRSMPRISLSDKEIDFFPSNDGRYHTTNSHNHNAI